MPTRYFVRRPGSEPWYVFRILPDVSVQVYDVAEHAWRARPLEPLYRWAIIDGEMGVDETSADEAAAIILTLDRSPNIRGQRKLVAMGRSALHRLDGPGAEVPRYTSVFEKSADEPQFEPAGDFLTVEGVLESLQVIGASRRKQRAAIARAAASAGLRPFLEKLAPQLRARGLLVDSPQFRLVE